MKRIEKQIPKAIKIIQEVIVEDENSIAVKPEFKGYFASFGASIVQSGLLPSVIFFENEDSDTQAFRHKVPTAILAYLLGETDNEEKTKDNKLSDYIINSPKSRRQLVKEVSEAAVALKIALRTFDLSN